MVKENGNFHAMNSIPHLENIINLDFDKSHNPNLRLVQNVTNKRDIGGITFRDSVHHLGGGGHWGTYPIPQYPIIRD